MPTNKEYSDELAREGLNGPHMRAAMIGTANDIMKRIERNFKRLKISPYNPRLSHDEGWRQTGDLKRSIFWQTWNATGGDEAKIRFTMLSVASFVELAVQGNRGDKKGGWKVRHGGLPASIPGANYGGIYVGRRNNKGVVLDRKAKPFISGEIRVHGRMLFDRMVKYYGYIGNMIMLEAINPKRWSKTKIINDNQVFQTMTDIMSSMHDRDTMALKGDWKLTWDSFKLDDE